MPENNTPLKHIQIEGYTQSDEYISPRRPGRPSIQSRNRTEHGRRIQDQLNLIREEFEALQETELPQGIVRDDAIYVEFISDFDFELAFDSFQSDKQSPNYILLSCKKEKINESDRFRVNVMLTEGGISHFIGKVEDYLDPEKNVKKKGVISETPRNNLLISNIETIQLATLEAFWTEPDQIPFPNEDEVVWWEVWFRRVEGSDLDFERARVSEQLRATNAQLGVSEINFPEHTVRLVRASASQLSNSLFLLDNLAELRKPKETADFFTHLGIGWSDKAINDLRSRIENETDNNSLAICLLDTGVQNMHPLLSDFFREGSLHSHKPQDWGTHDGWARDGHGTGMAGIALYGDLTEALSANYTVSIFHQLESVKILDSNDANDPELYAAITEEAASIPVINAPDRPRIYCMAVTDENQSFFGRPSSWSAALDKITFGSEIEGSDKQLFLVSGGNIWLENPEEYPAKNHIEGIHDPAQAYNSITVGGYTEKDNFDRNEFPESTLLTPKGGMAPSNSTSLSWERQWAIKPDIVMEAGNCLNQNGNLIEPHSLKLLSTGKQFQTNVFQAFGDTSAAVAMASRLAAQLKHEYPHFWPETIRGLMIHSSDWTPIMLNGLNLVQLKDQNKNFKTHLLRSFGFGVPNLDKARYSASNSLTLIAERTIIPFKMEQGGIKFNEMHLFDLPWPEAILQNELGSQDVKLNVTLSYYIEPNPGSRIYGSKYNYQSHALRFNVIKPNESLDDFQKRVNKSAREKDVTESYSGEDWVLGEQLHTKGSIHRDLWIGSGADLSTRNKIAIYPGVGWYRSRKRLGKYNEQVRYSLIVTIETSNENIDIYTPVLNQISVEIQN